MQMSGQVARRHAVLVRVVETAAMHRPQLTAHSLARELRVFRRAQMIVEPDEIERRADPRDADDEVKPSPEQAQPVEEVGGQGFTSRARRSSRRNCRRNRLPRCEGAPTALDTRDAGADCVHNRWCVQRLEQLRGDGDCDCGGRLAFDAGDAYRANQLLDERGRDAIFAKTRAKTGRFAFRADEAEPCKGVTLKNGVAQGVVERVIVSEDDVHRILWCFGEKPDRLRLFERANIRRQ